ncbi:MAG: hypothetical protein LBT26_06250, partial [Clostridiales Family XIII bacterium]|nr:hypothetical protein [Clostridiales Family XIII bacterium]
DPEDAFLYATRAVVLAGGRIIADAPPAKALAPELLSGLYGIEVALGEIVYKGKKIPACVPGGAVYT